MIAEKDKTNDYWFHPSWNSYLLVNKLMHTGRTSVLVNRQCTYYYMVCLASTERQSRLAIQPASEPDSLAMFIVEVAPSRHMYQMWIIWMHYSSLIGFLWLPRHHLGNMLDSTIVVVCHLVTKSCMWLLGWGAFSHLMTFWNRHLQFTRIHMQMQSLVNVAFDWPMKV